METNKSYSFEDLKKEWDRQEQWEKDHPFLSFPGRAFDFVRYTIPYRISDMKQAVRFAYQRVVRGYDDRWLWGYYSENTRQTLAVLRWMQEHKHGSPYTHDPENVLTIPDTPTDSEGVNDDWHKRWEEALQLMIEGFEALEEMEDNHICDENGKYDHDKSMERYEELQKKWLKGASLFIANYRGLWD